MSIKDIINVEISRETTAVSRAGFGTPLIVGTTATFPERIRFYSDLQGMLDDGFVTTSLEYLAAQALLSQSPRVKQFAIGRSDTTFANDIPLIRQESDDWYGLVITSRNADDIFDVAQYIETQNKIFAVASPDANNLGSPNILLTFDADLVASNNFDLNVNGTAITTIPFNVDNATTLNNIATELAGFTGLIASATVLGNEITVVPEAGQVVTLTDAVVTGGASQAGITVSNAAGADIIARLRDAGFARTIPMYHDQAATNFPDAAWLGRQLPTEPGSSTWKFKQLGGVSPSKLTSNERKILKDKNGNTYENRGGVSVTSEGTVASGEFIDIIRGVDWLSARITETIFTRLVNSEKVPFTDGGAAIIEADIRSNLDQGVAQGFLAADPPFEINIPRVADVPVLDRTARNLPDITFNAPLAGAVHSASINGVVKV